MTRAEHLARVDLAEALLARLNGVQRRALDELAPREVAVPSGSRIRLDYVDDNAPCIAVRLQEVFGLAATPRGGGAVCPCSSSCHPRRARADHARPGRVLEAGLP